ARGSGGQQARGELQQGALAGAVRTDDAQRLARRDSKANVAQRPELLAPAARTEGAQDEVLQGARALVVNGEALGNAFEANGGRQEGGAPEVRASRGASPPRAPASARSRCDPASHGRPAPRRAPATAPRCCDRAPRGRSAPRRAP